MAILEWLVGLGQGDGGEAASLEQCTLGLITLRDVVMHRQAERSACLALVLRCTVHADDALRGKAIRMVVNQLHPLAFAAPEVESFASERLESVLSVDEADGVVHASRHPVAAPVYGVCGKQPRRAAGVSQKHGASVQECSSRARMLSFCPCHRLALRARLGRRRLRFCS